MDIKLIIFCFINLASALDVKNLTGVMSKLPEILNDPKSGTTQLCSTFEELILCSKMWVDKSLIIKEIWNENSTDVFVVTAPRGWGKTITLSMVGYYHQLPINDDGSVADRKKSRNYIYFTEGKVAYRYASAAQCNCLPLISSEQSLNNEHLANHPVIYIDGEDHGKDFIDHFQSMIWNTYQKHASLYEFLRKKSSIPINDGEKTEILLNLEKFQDYYNWTKIQNLDRKRLKQGIKILSDLLEKTYERKVVILFDEYDNFISNTYVGYACLGVPSSKVSDDFVDFLQGFMYETFRVNTHLVKGFITGVLPMLEITGLSGLNNVALKYVFGIDSFFPYYGILEHELCDLVYEREIVQSSMERAVSHYGGYHALGHLDDSMCSAYSSIQFVNTKVVKDCWTLTPGVSDLFKQRNFSLDIGKVITNWYEGKSAFKITYNQMTELTLQDLETIFNISTKKIYYESDKHRNLVFSFFVSVGFMSVYFNQSSSNYQQYPIKTPETVDIELPNKEIYAEMKWYIFRYVNKYVNSLTESGQQEFQWVNRLI
ncbi:uncharacterized protein LOC135840250 [Planococcus citri]|uniref:uncharacterized protein LOC135840250 n=1 Tax=Planococcus citri TaxID=170843 RepID=UPI0031F9D301